MEAVVSMAVPAALLTGMMILIRTLRNFLKGRIWQDRKEEMQIFSFMFIFFLLGKPWLMKSAFISAAEAAAQSRFSDRMLRCCCVYS